jgi:hypothetical protein
MLASSNASARRTTTQTTQPALVERVRQRIAHFGSKQVWARCAGQHVLIGLDGQDAYARISPVRGAFHGLAFRSESVGDGEEGHARGETETKWDGLLLIDTLGDVVEHALVAADALPVSGSQGV